MKERPFAVRVGEDGAGNELVLCVGVVPFQGKGGRWRRQHVSGPVSCREWLAPGRRRREEDPSG